MLEEIESGHFKIFYDIVLLEPTILYNFMESEIKYHNSSQSVGTPSRQQIWQV